MGFKVGVTSGIYSAARSDELAEAIRKLGYGLTRGARVIEVAMDVPHEITYTDGKVMQEMARKQGVEITLHGSLTIPMAIPERSDYRDAQDHMRKSIRSAIYCGARYVDFHASLNIWLELMTYAGRKLTMSFCDHEGHFISRILKENAKLRKWFVNRRGDLYANDILNRDENSELNLKISEITDSILKRHLKEKVPGVLRKLGIPEIFKKKARARGLPEPSEQEVIDDFVNQIVVRNTAPSIGDPKVEEKLDEEIDRIKLDAQTEIIKARRDTLINFLEQKLSKDVDKGGKWDSEELRAVVGILDGYHIMAHHLFFSQDRLWKDMSKMYEEELKPYKLDPNDIYSLEKAWEKAEEENDRGFKEFFYAVVASKFLEGHMLRLMKWMENDLIKKEIPSMGVPQKEKERLIDNAKKLLVAIENPDARDPSHAGLHLLWHPKQIYVAVKDIRDKLKNDRVFMLMDFEHLAGQGVDPMTEMEDVAKKCPDIGEITLSVHSNSPNPSHAHLPLELGDERIYRLLWTLRKTGLGRKRDAYLIFERGGGDDPFKQSIDVLRLCARYLERDIPPDELPEEYYGLKGPISGDFERQFQIIRDHMFEPMKDLLEMPEEEWGMFSSAVLKKGKRPEQWKKAEFR